MELVAAVAERARQVPDAVAFEGPSGQHLDYAGLVERSGALATGLRFHGIEPGNRVALLLPRDIDLFIAQLAILQAGGCFVPLDRDQPDERLVQLLQAADCALVITEDMELAAAARAPATTVQGLLDHSGSSAPEKTAAPEEPAYCLFTSGSTGFPNGVLISRAALDRYVTSYADLVGCGPGERGAQLGSPGFDVIIDELWPFLATGATVVIASDADRATPARLAAWLRESHITNTYIPPLLLESLFRSRTDLGEVHMVRTGGERLAVYPPPEFPCRVLNEYGPTETVAGATTCDVSAWAERTELPPVGRPLPHVELSVRDESGAIVAAGTPGELYIGGPTVGIGYLRDPDRTAARFVQIDGARWFRTGDLVRELPTGDLEFLHRIDNQVQLLGKRVDLGEVEQAVRAHPAVQRSVVLAPQDRFGRAERLECYVRWESGAVGADPESLRAHVAEQLPDYLVPSNVHEVDNFPVTPAGKVDRQALAYQHAADGRTAPEVPLPGLVALWRQALNVEDLGADDDFFMHGGTSAVALELAVAAQQRWGRPVTARDVFTHTTPRELAAALNHNRRPEGAL